MKNWLALFLLFTPVVGFADNVASKPANLQETCIQELGGTIQVNCQTQFNLVTITSGTVPSFTVVGSTTGLSAPIGRIGQVITAYSSNISFPLSGQFGDLATITLTSAGTWLIQGGMYIDGTGVTASQYRVGISQTTGNSETGMNVGDNESRRNLSVVEDDLLVPPGYVVSVTASTPVYLKFFAAYTLGTPKGYGRITAIRIF